MYKSYVLFCVMACLVALTASSAFAQVLSGKVTSDGAPLIGANVGIKGTNIGTSTNEDGSYTLKLGAGIYEVTFSLVGYARKTETVTLKENEDRQLNMELKQETLERQEVVVVGTRATSRTITDSPVPVDVLSAQEISHSGQNSFDKTLQYRVPSFNTAQTPVNDATALLDPWEIRNMGVSRTLILVNGKRKNLSSLVYTQTSPSRGESGVDLSAIPMAAIKRVEILRDGASALYGSDAIAGVVNIVLKDNTDGGFVTVNGGVTHEGDGGTFGVALNNGSSIFSDKGFINYTVDLSRVNEARRSGIVDAQAEADPVIGFGADINAVNDFLAYDKYAGNRNSSPATLSSKFLVNTGIQVSDLTEFYANAAYVYKEVNSFANYRTPYWRTYTDFPYLASPAFFGDGDSASYKGYVPTFDGVLNDYNATFGLKTQSNGWNFDGSLTLGRNSQDYTVRDSHNRSDIKDTSGANVYRENSPIIFKPGGTAFSNTIGNLDVSKAVTDQLSIGFGTEFRSETFTIMEGDKASWDGLGADSYAGNRPENSGTFDRFNFGGYFDANYDITKSILISGTIRDEFYGDFGNAFVYKGAGRVKLFDDRITLRGSYSTGFKAPTLHQIYTQRAQYSFVAGGAIQVIGLINNVSPQARALGVGSLQPEKSTNITVGMGLILTENIDLTLDFYNIAIDDRIVISNRVTIDTVTGSQVEFFTNSIDTKTAGVDVVLDYKNIKAGGGAFGVSLAGNFNLTNERDGAIPQVKGTDVIDATQEALFFTSRPKEKVVLGITYDMERLGFSLYNTYFGSTEFHQAGLDANLKTVFDPKVVTDLGVTYNIWGSITIAGNVNNIFNILPVWKFESLNATGDAILADPAQVWVQTNLITFNGRYSTVTYDGAHFSQLGTIYSLSLTYGL